LQADPRLLDKLQAQRRLWQDMGYLSRRKYPAQVILLSARAIQIALLTIHHDK
jgi:hypothetical protein